MFNQDYIMRQIQQLTQVLNRILVQVLKLKKSNSTTEIVNFTNEKLKETLDTDIDELSSIIDSKGPAYLKKEKNFNNENLNILADIFYELAENYFEESTTHQQSLKLYSQSLQIYEFIEADEKIYSIDRNVKITKIKDVLE
jgi:paraquat-inducible protein B